MKRILITGSLGLVGSACLELFTHEGWEVVGMDNNGRSKLFGTPTKPGLNKGKNWIQIDCDIRNQGAVEAWFREYKFDAIIHAAAQPSHDYATEHVLEDFDINARGTVILLEATRKYCPDATFVYVSTDKVYGQNMSTSLLEGETRYEANLFFKGFDESLDLDFARDRSFFGCSKVAADLYVQQYGVRFHMKTACFRPGCITGKNHEGAEMHGFLAYLAKCIKEGKRYKIFGNGKTVRDQIHANDLAKAFWHFIENPHVASVYNIGGGPERSISILEAGELISKKLDELWLREFHEERKGDRRWDVHDVSEFCKDYPEWDYKYSLEDIINDVISK